MKPSKNVTPLTNLPHAVFSVKTIIFAASVTNDCMGLTLSHECLFNPGG